MRSRTVARAWIFPGAVLTAVLFVAAAGAQWKTLPERSVPRPAAGEAALAVPAPRAPDGKPDLSGIWLPDADPTRSSALLVEGDHAFPRHMINIAADLEPGGVPFRPWAAELFEQRLTSRGTTSPPALCKPTGVPWLNASPLPYKIVQTSALIVILYEENTVFRQVFLDGREPVEDAVPRWMGYSTGAWHGDELVVETVGITDRSWLDAMGHPHSDRLRVLERFRRRDAGHLDIEITIDDPVAYSRPISYTITTTAVPEQDLLEYFCAENEKSSANYE